MVFEPARKGRELFLHAVRQSDSEGLLAADGSRWNGLHIRQFHVWTLVLRYFGIPEGFPIADPIPPGLEEIDHAVGIGDKNHQPFIAQPGGRHGGVGAFQNDGTGVRPFGLHHRSDDSQGVEGVDGIRLAEIEGLKVEVQSRQSLVCHRNQARFIVHALQHTDGNRRASFEEEGRHVIGARSHVADGVDVLPGQGGAGRDERPVSTASRCRTAVV